MNPLDKYPKVREALYLGQWIVSGLLFITSAVVLVVTKGDVPLWLAATTAGFNAYTAVTGRTAQSNVPVVHGEDPVEPDPDADADVPYEDTV